MLAILDPITLEKTISLLPDKRALKLTKSSGQDVAKETTVKPTTNFEIRAFDAILTEPSTNNSPPKYRRKRPKIISR